MGLIKAAFGAAGGVMADQWKEFFYCEALPADVLAVKGKKKVTGRSSNTKGDDNIITNGSIIAVANGQCMLIVEQGQIVDMCAEPGEYTYDTSTEPSLFTGDLGESIKGVFQNIGKRFTFGGEAPKDQRVYYFNTKELTGNKYGTPSPVPFRVVDQRAAIDMDIGIRCFGEYSVRLTNPMLFYKNVCGNVTEDFRTEQIAGGVLLNQKVAPQILAEPEDCAKLSMLLRTFFDDLHGFHVQYNVVSKETLLDAQIHPEKHRDLIVRVAGYSAFFNVLSRKTQDDIIARTEQVL